MSYRNLITRGVALPALALAMAMHANGAAAQQADDESVDEDEEDTIIVTGYRQSLEAAIDTKKSIDVIVESVTAEDIGRLPDASIGESIARLPGLTSQRLNGRANVISIRGFGPDFSQTLLNGREQTTTGDNRGVEFDQYPSEIVSELVVYKTPSASLVGQGLVGTVDIRTIRPLESGEQILAIGARGSVADLGALNAGSTSWGWRINGTYVDQFGDEDQLGIALAVAYVDEPYQLEEFNAWGYAGNYMGTGNSVIGGSKSFVTSTRLKRLGINATVQFEPTPDLMITIDGFYSDFDDDQIKRGIELPLGWGGGVGFEEASNPQVQDGLILNGTFTNVVGVVRNDVFQRQAKIYSFGTNFDYESDNGWHFFADFGYSRTNRNELSIESYSGTGYNLSGAGDDISFTTTPRGAVFDPTIDYSNAGALVLTSPQGWGSNDERTQMGYYNDRIITDELKQYRAQVEKEFEDSFISAVKVGFSYTDRDKGLVPDEYFVVPGGGNNAVREVDIPREYLLDPTNLNYLGLGPMISYDPRVLIAEGVLGRSPNDSRDIPAKAFTISEELITLYGQADINTLIGDSELTGNFGVQAIRTNQSSSGIVYPSNDRGDTSVAQDVTLGTQYWDILPSLNLSLRLPESDIVVRMAVSRQIMRPRLDDMRIALEYGINRIAGQTPFVSGSGGNPLLEPYRAWGVDVNVEKYFGDTKGYVALQFFYKRITSYIADGRFPFDFSSLPEPQGRMEGETINLQGAIDARVNTDGGNIWGLELGATVPFDLFTQSLEGFGITGGVSYTRSQVTDVGGNIVDIPGYSRWVANGTAYFERWGFNTRASLRYRSTFLGDFVGFGGSPTRRQALGEMIIDAQIGYDFPESSALNGMSLYVQGQNLTDERFASVANVETPLYVIDYQIYGRRFLFGFTYKFR